jgi:hypothetical protein
MLAEGLTRSSWSRFGFSSLLLLTLLPFACRVRYDELEAQAAAGASASNGGASSFGGAEISQAGSNGGTAGTDNSAGATATAGASALGGAGGDATTTGGTSATGGNSTTCESSADCACDALDGHDYWFCTQHLYWGDAEAHCESAGMFLVRIDSQAENDWLMATGTGHGVFEFNDFAQIGANDQAVAGEWRWPDGTLFWQGGANGKAVGGAYASWDASAPSASGVQKCSGTLGDGLWQDRSCTAAEPFICERY